MFLFSFRPFRIFLILYYIERSKEQFTASFFCSLLLSLFDLKSLRSLDVVVNFFQLSFKYGFSVTLLQLVNRHRL